MGDDPLAWMIPGGAFFAVVLYFVMKPRSERKRERYFRALAAHRDTIVEVISENSSRFSVTIDDRTIDVRDEYRGGGIGSSASGIRYLTTATVLRGRSWDLHSVKINRRWLYRSRSGEPFERRVNVEDLGLPMPADWVTADVRAAIESMFDLGIAAAQLEIDAGELLHRSMASPVELDAATLDLLLERHVALARAVERARPR